MKGKTVLLLGGTGTLSKATLDVALYKGFEVTIMTRGLRKIFIPEGVGHIICDFTSDAEMENVFDNREFDIVVDFLSRTPEDIKRVYSFFANKCTQFIFISSSCVYRRASEDFPIKESSPKPNPDWLYNIKKYEAERVLEALSTENTSYYTIVRPYITYDDQRIPFGITPEYKYHKTIIERIKSGKPWFIWNNGETVTTVTHTIDFANLLVGLFLNKKAVNQDFHITGGFSCKQSELVYLLFSKLGIEPNIVNVDLDDFVSTLPEYGQMLIGDRSLDAVFDNTKLFDAVEEYKPRITIDEGIERVLAYWESNKETNYDYRFDARIDRLLSHYTKVGFHKYPSSRTDSRLLYFLYRYMPLPIATRLSKWLS